MYFLIGICVIVIAIVAMILAVIKQYRKCPANQILVKYGKVGKGQASQCIHGGASFIVPIFQAYEYMDLRPLQIDVNLENALSNQNIRVNLPSSFTVGISTESHIMQNAAERLLGLSREQIKDKAADIIFGQLRAIVADLTIEEINNDRTKFQEKVSTEIGEEINKIGLYLINVNIKDISDEQGFIEALGKKAASEVTNKAKVEVAKKDKEGAIGEAEALKDQKVSVAKSNAEAIKGENEAKATEEKSNAKLREDIAEVKAQADSKEKIAQAEAEKEALEAEKDMEEAKKAKELAAKEASEIVDEEIDKKKKILQAEAKAEEVRLDAEAQANAEFAKMQAKANGIKEILTKQAEGINKIVEAVGGSAKDASLMLIIDKLPEIVEQQVKAISNLKIDKITIWDNGAGNTDGKTSTSNFLAGMVSALPPLKGILNQAGMELPEMINGKSVEEENVKEETDQKKESKVQEVTEPVKSNNAPDEDDFQNDLGDNSESQD